MELKEVIETAINPAMKLLPAKMSSTKSLIMLLAIGLQESRFEHRRQIGGPARGFWQFERGGGVKGVMTHKASKTHAEALCKARGVEFSPQSVYEALERDDVLAAGFARLLLYTDPKALPEPGDEQGAWDLYLRVWRPGKPHRHTWDALYARALSVAMTQTPAQV